MSEFQDIREACSTANRELPKLGLVDMTFGNASVCDPDANVMAIKPSGVDYDELTPSKMVIVSLEGSTQTVIESNNFRPSSDTPTHHRLYQLLPGIRCIVHTHSRKATAWAQAGRSIPCLGTTHADFFNGPVPVTREMTPSEVQDAYEWHTGEVIAECFGEINHAEVPAVLVRGHAPFVWGASCEKALGLASALEIVAEIAIDTLSLNPNAQEIQSHLLSKHFWRKHGDSAYYGQP